MNEDLLKKYKEIIDINAKYLSLCEPLMDEQFNKKPSDKEWSLAQVLFHLWTAELQTLKGIEKGLTKEKLENSNFISTIRSIGLEFILSLPLKFKAPESVSKVPAHIPFLEMKTKMEKTNNEFQQLLLVFPMTLKEKHIFRHPIVGLLNIHQTLGFLKGHFLHHKMQIDGLVKNI